VEGDGRTGIRSLPVQLGTLGAARLACLVMAVPQVAVILGLFAWNRPWHGTVIGVLLLGQFVLMRRLLAAPRERAAWYNGTGTTLYVLGMLVAAFALRPLVQGGP
jgi:chlorophyll synthase